MSYQLGEHTMKTVQLDIAHDCTLGDFLEMVKTLELEYKVIEVYGPAGANPLIEFTGPNRSISILMESLGV
jgi:hypothetical protein